MKNKFIIPILAIALFSCNGNKIKTETTEAPEEIEAAKISLPDTQWKLMSYVGKDGVTEVDSATYLLSFNADGTFGMQTDCNSIGGEFTLKGDSIQFTKTVSTLMACPDENVEQAMKEIFPVTTTYTISPDSVLSLRFDARIMAQFQYAKDLQAKPIEIK